MIDKLVERGNRAMCNLFILFTDAYLVIDKKLFLFDSLVGLVLSYSCEVWGYHNANTEN